MAYHDPVQPPAGPPLAVHVVAVFHYVAGALALLSAGVVAFTAAGRRDLTGADLPPALRDRLASMTFGTAVGLTVLGFSVIYLGRRLHTRRRWAWLLVMALSVPSAVLTFVAGLEGRQINVMVGLVLPLLYVILLGGASTRQWFGGGRDRPPGPPPGQAPAGRPVAGYPPRGRPPVAGQPRSR